MQDNGGMKLEKKEKKSEVGPSCLMLMLALIIVCGTVLGTAWIVWGGG